MRDMNKCHGNAWLVYSFPKSVDMLLLDDDDEEAEGGTKTINLKSHLKNITSYFPILPSIWPWWNSFDLMSDDSIFTYQVVAVRWSFGDFCLASSGYARHRRENRQQHSSGLGTRRGVMAWNTLIQIYCLLNDAFVPLSSGPITCTNCRPVDRLPLAVAVVVYSGTAKCLAVNTASWGEEN